MERQVKYGCECCKYFTNVKKHYNVHLLSQKHIKNAQNGKELSFECRFCKKTFKSNSGLWKHSKKCNQQITTIINNTTNITNNITNNNTTINNNINIFLNENCKNALNITDFIALLKIKMADLDKIYNAITKTDYAKAIGDFIVKNNNKISIDKRPMHCIAETGETTIHFKDEDEWKQEDYKNETPKLSKMVDNVVNNSVITIPDVVGPDNSSKYKFKKIRKKMIKFHGDDSVNKKIVSEIAGGITIPSVPAISDTIL